MNTPRALTTLHALEVHASWLTPILRSRIAFHKPRRSIFCGDIAQGLPCIRMKKLPSISSQTCKDAGHGLENSHQTGMAMYGWSQHPMATKHHVRAIAICMISLLGQFLKDTMSIIVALCDPVGIPSIWKQ